jgi:ubiquinone/menaquinone biosynthesis C-methylase UbiE
MLRFVRRDNPYMLVIGMAGVKLGDCLLQVGCADGGQLGAIASKVGLSGRAVAVVPDDAAAVRARKGAAAAGVLVEVEVAPPASLPLDDASFDLAVIDDTAGLLGAMTESDRHGSARELLRVLRPGGRLIVIGRTPRTSLGSLLGKAPGTAFDAGPLLQDCGFRAVRNLAEREGLAFVEGVKPRG